ncbi:MULTISPECIES: MarC family protein [Parachlamydia]|jgi:multiple antibiotic resistance protein|uniref:UPF0056 inner membrane protein n=2 Tax=Parachlamydia acanthamoebae TaxID=83552 RepID=F8L0L9_PARAV|nr:MarC family protein [Parachlamydia acanthamoebae]EFB41475.1 hypothetical protein pah_c032o037 [Parachlamydia acanthamoebae str. Hall's coccus]CCB86769.1 UPF0056 membrane protein BUsg_434 [Parachlamydia acanthamoebae UV-7]
MNDLSLFSITLVLFLIMDPLGNIGSFREMLKRIDPKKQKIIIMREMLIALFTMLVFNFLGEVIFEYLQVTETTVQISSGIILFLAALKILFPSKDSPRSNLPQEEPFIIPLAIPLVAGPSLLATIMLYAHMETSVPLMLGSIFIAWGLASIILLFSNRLYTVLGNNGLVAFEKLMGMVLILLAIQRFLEGVENFVKTLPPA